MKSIKFFLLLFLFNAPVVLATEVNSNSMYQYESTWLDQNNESTTLATLQGDPQLVAFVYTYCEHTCPLIISEIKSIIEALSNNDSVRITLVTLDPVRDTPEIMKAYMHKHGLDENKWTMLVGDPDDVRVLANLFGVKYKPMQKDQLAHSNMITLLDRQGVIQYQLKGLHLNKGEIVQKITSL